VLLKKVPSVLLPQATGLTRRLNEETMAGLLADRPSTSGSARVGCRKHGGRRRRGVYIDGIRRRWLGNSWLRVAMYVVMYVAGVAEVKVG
jgi:hypothetical protein